MLHLELNAFESLAGPFFRYKGTIECLRGGKRGDFRIALSDERGEPVAQGQLLSYPRWTESLEAFVARCLQSALQASPFLPRPALRVATLTVHLNRQCLQEYQAAWPQDWVPPGASAELAEEGGYPTAWELIQRRLAFLAWGSDETPSMPAAVEPRVYYAAGVEYCRLSDLPLDARLQCERWMWGLSMPRIAGVEDACYAADMARFLGY